MKEVRCPRKVFPLHVRRHPSAFTFSALLLPASASVSGGTSTQHQEHPPSLCDGAERDEDERRRRAWRESRSASRDQEQRACAMQGLMPPKVHFLEFGEGNNPAHDPERFHVLWQMDTTAPPPPASADADDEWGGIAVGDLVVFPSLLSGAGELEAVRFVGQGEREADVVLPLLPAGIEYPEFPALVAAMAEGRGASLRELYEAPLDAVLRSQPPGLGLVDLFGNDEGAYKEFWEDVPIARRRGPPRGSPWKFSLGECVWVRTLKFDTDGRTGSEEL